MEPAEPNGLDQPKWVSSALKLPRGRQARPLRRAVAIIDEVHRDGRLPRVDVVIDTVEGGEASIDLYSDPTRTARISVSPRARSIGWSLIHEIGHLLDLASLGTIAQPASAYDEGLDVWRSAVAGSVGVRRLVRLREEQRSASGLVKVSRLLEYHELWARSYAQFVTSKSGDPDLRNHLEWRRLKSHARHAAILQWEDVDFSPIADAIEALFRRRRWIL